MNKDIILKIGATLVLCGAICVMTKILIFTVPLSTILIGIGALLIFYAREFHITPEDGRLKRLKFQTFISTILMLVSAYLIYINDGRWAITLLVVAIIELVVAFRTPNQTT